MKFLAALLASAVFAQAAAPTLTNLNTSPTQPPADGSVRLNATVDTRNLQTTLTYRYALSAAAYDPRKDIEQPIAPSAAPTNAFINVRDLVGGQSYKFQITATNVDGSVTADGPPFTMPVVKPTIQLRTPETNPNGTVTLKANIIANGTDVTSVTFKYGTDTNYSNGEQTISPPMPPISGSDVDGVEVTQSFTGLTRGLTYRYQVTATNSAGTATTENRGTFTFPQNRPPVARPDTVRLLGDNPITIDVLKNDSDPDGDDFHIQEITQGKQGRVRRIGDKLLYTPSPDASGSDTFTYVIVDEYSGSVRSATGTVTIIAPTLSSRGLHAAEIKDEEGNVMGMVRLLGTGSGTVSGKVQIFTKTYSVYGQIDENGNFYFTMPRDGDPLQLTVNFNDPEANFKATLTSDDGKWTADSGLYTLSNERRDEIVGKYTVEFPAPGGEGDDLPQGTGFARLDVKPWGEVTWKGRLNDGSKFAGTGVLNGTENAASVSFWITPDESRISAQFDFGNTNGANVTGTMKWYREPDDGADFFPNGFYLELTPNGSPYDAPEDNRALKNAKKATLTLSDGNLAETITQAVEISKSDRVNLLNSNPYVRTLEIDTEDGTFQGTFNHPFDNSYRKFRGVLLQAQEKGSGVFTGIDQTGSVSLTIGIAEPVPTPTPTPTPNPNPNPNPTPTPNPNPTNPNNGLNFGTGR